MKSRLLSNVVVLAIFVAGFFGVSFALNFFSTTEVQIQQEHSLQRRSADRLYQERDWEGAARFYQQLLAADPNNGGAAMAYADCIAQRRVPYLRTIYQQRRSENPDEVAIREAIEQANDQAETVIPAYEYVLRFPRHRNLAEFALARIHALRDEKQIAIDYLLSTLNQGFRPRYSLYQYFEFRSIIDEPEIRELAYGKNR